MKPVGRKVERVAAWPVFLILFLICFIFFLCLFKLGELLHVKNSLSIKNYIVLNFLIRLDNLD